MTRKTKCWKTNTILEDQHHQMVLVFDKVFSPAACAVLHTAACSRARGHALFPREQPGSAIETALASFLNEV